MDDRDGTAARPITVQEVGLRDGLQSIARVMPTERKAQWIDAAHAAGVRHMEVASFVPARLLPQMADAAAVIAHALGHPDLVVTALAPNLKGAENALACGVHRITVPVSVSAAHSLANVRKTPREACHLQALLAVRRLLEAALPGEPLSGSIARAGLPKNFVQRSDASAAGVAA